MTHQMTCGLKVRGGNALILHSAASCFAGDEVLGLDQIVVSHACKEIIDAPHVLIIATTRGIEA